MDIAGKVIDICDRLKIPYIFKASYRKAMSQYLSILASETEIEGVDLAAAEGPLVQ